MDEFSPLMHSEDLNGSSTSPELPPYEKTLIRGKQFFKCLSPGCSKLFRFKSDMERHVVIHTNARPYPCPHPSCNKTFKRPDALKSHMHTHNEEIHLECPVPGCKAQFQKKSSFQYHLLKHQKPDHYVCNAEDCNKTFTSYNDLKQHQKKNCQCQERKSSSSSSSSSESTKRQNSQDNIFSPDHEFEAIFVEEEEWSPKPTKALHIENKQRKPMPRKDSWDFSEILTQKQSEFILDQKPSGSKFVKFLQTICKVLMDENENLKKQLADQMINVQSRYGVEDSSTFFLEHALDF